MLCRACALKAVALEGFLWFCIVSMVSMVSYGFYGLLQFLTVSMVAVVCMFVRVSMIAVLFQLYACQGFVACMVLMVPTSFHCFCCFYCFYGLWFLDLHSIISLKVFIDRHPGQQFPKCPWCRRALPRSLGLRERSKVGSVQQGVKQAFWNATSLIWQTQKGSCCSASHSFCGFHSGFNSCHGFLMALWPLKFLCLFYGLHGVYGFWGFCGFLRCPCLLWFLGLPCFYGACGFYGLFMASMASSFF